MRMRIPKGLGRSLAAFLVVVVLGLGCHPAASPSTTAEPMIPVQPAIVGAGGSMTAVLLGPVMNQYNKSNPHATVSYQVWVDAQGIELLKAGKVAFAGIDLPRRALELDASAPKAYAFLPIGMDAIVVAYNLPNLKKPIVLDATVLAGIFSGTITSWASDQIRMLNPDQHVPDLAITVIHARSATTVAWLASRYLAANDEAWAETVRGSYDAKWPVGLSVPMTDRLLEKLQETTGSIALLPFLYGAGNSVPPTRIASVININHETIVPSEDSIAAAGASITATGAPLDDVNPKGRGAYPLAVYVQIAVPRHVAHRPPAFWDFLRAAVTAESRSDALWGPTISVPKPTQKEALEIIERLRVGERE
jgi:phosphate transport system substrate-binding protein